MSDISNQLIKDSYNYVLQSDLSSGTVYRIGGSIPVNPKFLSGLTVNSGFTYSNGTEQVGYALLTDGTGYAYWGPISAATPSSGVTSITVGNGLSADSSTGAVTIVFTGSTSSSGDYLPLSGGTVTGGTVFQSGLTANTFYSSGQVGIGTSNPNAKAIIEIASTTQGVLFPRMTLLERDLIVSPPLGLILFVTDGGDNEGLYIYKTSGWVQII
jgi:hypothetical protein